MGLRQQAAADLRAIVEDDTSGFGWPIRITNPDGESIDIVGLSTDVATVIDPDTGMAVKGRNASIAVALGTLEDEGFEIPKGITDATSKPWVVRFDDIQGTAHTFKVMDAEPDRAIGVVVCLLEAYEPAVV